MASTAFSAIVDQLLTEPGLTGPVISNRLGYKFSAATIGNTSLTTTDPQIVRIASNTPSNIYASWYIYLFTAGEERVVTTTTIAGSTATMNFIGGGNATNQASPTTVYLTQIPWSEIKAAANDGLEYIPCECIDVLRHGPDDAFMQANNTTSWTGTNGTVAKQTTDTEVLHGKRSTSLTLTAGSGYMTSTTSRIGQDEAALVQALAKADTGTGILRSLDHAGNTISSSYDVSFTQEQWLYIRKWVNVASDDEGIALRVLGTDNNDQIDVQAAWIVNAAENVFRLPSYIDERFKLKAVARRQYMQSGRESDTWLANSYRDIRLQEDVDYRFINLPSDANPLGLEMITDWFRREPIMLFSETPYSAPYGVSATFSADSDTTNCRPHLLTAYLKKWIGSQLPGAFPDAERRGEREFKERMHASRTSLPTLPFWAGPAGTRRI